MISVEWENNGTCDNCGKDKAHCAQLHIEPERPVDTIDVLLCSDCVGELKKKLS